MNIVNELKKVAFEYPDKIALKFPKRKLFGGYKYQQMTFHELNQAIDQYAAHYERVGITKGDKTLFFVKPCLDFTAMVFALFKVGAIPVLIDPGMGRKNLLKAIQSVRPRALIAVSVVHFLRLIFKSFFHSIDIFITTGQFKFNKMESIKDFSRISLESTSVCELDEDETAAILFTSGGTGIPKGVLYTHKIFATQTKILKELFKLNPNEVDLPGFPDQRSRHRDLGAAGGTFARVSGHPAIGEP